MTAAVVAVHCLPLPLVLSVERAFAMPLAAAIGISLVFHLFCQRIAGGATRLEAASNGEWFLYVSDKNAAKHRRGKAKVKVKVKVRYIDQFAVGNFALLLIAKGRLRFRLLVFAAAQNQSQWHRLRVLRMARKNS